MPSLPTAGPLLDADSREWPRSLKADGRTGEEALARLHALLLRVARFEVARRRPLLPHLRPHELDDIAFEAAADALVNVLRRVDDFRGESRFSTWVLKFAVREAAVKLRKRAWQAREVPAEPEAWGRLATTGLDRGAQVEECELLSAVQSAVTDELTPQERWVLVALSLDGVPIDVLAEQLETTRGALYKILHDARSKLRRHLGELGSTVP